MTIMDSMNLFSEEVEEIDDQLDSMYLFSEETEETDDHHGLHEFIF
jgi:hypothetical protein